MFPRKGQYKEALDDIIQILGPDEHNLHCDENLCEGCKWERIEAIRGAKAALGLPVPRQKCKVCGALDQIYWSKDDPGEENKVGLDAERPMRCHKCNTVEPESEWVDLPMEEEE